MNHQKRILRKAKALLRIFARNRAGAAAVRQRRKAFAWSACETVLQVIAVLGLWL